MVRIHYAYDELLKSNYELYSIKFSELQTEVKSWYKEDLKRFDERLKLTYKMDDTNSIAKLSGIVSNYFYAYKNNDGKMLLMDGYNRLLSDIGSLPLDPIVYIKVLTDDLSDSRLMSIMFTLNAWKLSKSGSSDSKFNANNFLDRGFRLFLYSKFDILLHERKRNHDDMDILDEYFHNENEHVAYFNYVLSDLFVLFQNEKIIEDFKHILKHNEYTEETNPFIHYDTFFRGYIRFLSRRRLSNDMGEHFLETYLDMLKADKKFFSKLQGMSWTDSTRKNIFLFFDKIEKDLNIKK